jgi:GT2 family glycosyltransferase/glycosyltransferase involved in cell wall biosynthesis
VIRSRLVSLPRRAWLTLKYLGPGQAILRVLTFPLRPTPIGRWLGYGRSYGPERVKARRWYRENGRDVTVVIPTYGDPGVTIKCVRSLRRTTYGSRVRIVVCDDASPDPEHRRRLATLRGAEVIQGEEQLGFARNANRGLRIAEGDVVLLNNDIVAHRGWLETLQQAAYASDEVGMAAPKLLYPDGRIQSAGSHRNLGAPEWFDHRYRFQEATYGPANVPGPVLAATGAALYVKRSTIERIGVLDDDFEMAFEDADWCLRCWQEGLEIIYQPFSELTHLESVTRGMEQGARELASKDLFWSRWGDFFERRGVRTAEGKLRVVYVTWDTGVGGGHRDVFEHLNRLIDRGHEAELWTRRAGAPDWFDLRAPVRSFDSLDELAVALEPLEAIKVATWWATAPPVWLASVRNGIPAYFVQDIETSYYPDRPDFAYRVADTYRHEFRYMTISEWNRERLAEYGVQARLVPPGVNLDEFRERPDVQRRDDELLVIGRDNPLKNLPLTMAAYELLGDDRPRMRMFGVEPEVGERYGIPYLDSPPDEEVARLFNEATVFVQTSIHEGFCLPPLEAMAAGCAVVCTDAHGNRDFCRDGENCLMPEPTPAAVAAAIRRLFDDPELRARLVAEGKRTAAAYTWERRTDELETALEAIAEGEAVASGAAG